MTRQGGEASLNKRYLIWSNGHRGWWKGNRHGYTTLTHRAGQFSFEEAMPHRHFKLAHTAPF